MQSHNPHQNPFRLQDHPDQRNADARAQHHGGDTGLAFGPRHCCAGQTREEPGHSRNSGRTSASHRDGHHCQPRRHHRQRHSERSHDGHWGNQRTGHDIGDEGIRSKLWLKCHNDGPAQQLGGERNGHSGSHPSGNARGYPGSKAAGQEYYPERCQYGQEKSRVRCHGRVKKQQNRCGDAKERQGTPPKAAHHGGQPYSSHDGGTHDARVRTDHEDEPSQATCSNGGRQRAR